MGGRIGSSFVGASSTDAVEEYDPATDTWRVARAHAVSAQRHGVPPATAS